LDKKQPTVFRSGLNLSLNSLSLWGYCKRKWIGSNLLIPGCIQFTCSLHLSLSRKHHGLHRLHIRRAPRLDYDLPEFFGSIFHLDIETYASAQSQANPYRGSIDPFPFGELLIAIPIWNLLYPMTPFISLSMDRPRTFSMSSSLYPLATIPRVMFWSFVVSSKSLG